MKHLLPKTIYFLAFFLLISCKKNETAEVAKSPIAENSIEYASGLSIVKHEGYSIVTVSNAWPNANKDFKYILM